MKPPIIEIDGSKIGPGLTPYIIAELSGNHNGDINRAFAIMEAAKNAGADAVKLQTYTADTMTIRCERPEFRINGGLWDGRTLYDLYEWAHTPWEWHEALFAKGRDLGITVFSTPFDETAVDFLEGLDVPAYKIASFENNDLPLIAKTAATGKPLILSTGLADLEEISEAVETARAHGCEQLALLHCVSAYPAPPEEANLRTIAALADKFSVVAGFSDHTPGAGVAIAAIASGAAIIEKHLTIKRTDGGPDAAFSLEPDELRILSEAANVPRQLTDEVLLGKATFERTPGEEANRVFRRSIFAVKGIAANDVFTSENIRIIRPGHGLPPKCIGDVLGRHAARALEAGEPLDWDAVRE